MPADFSIAKFSNELEDAGWLGLSAASILTIIGLAEDQPGAYSSTADGFVWTKTLDTSAGEERFNFGIGELVVSGGLLTGTLGVAFKGGKPSNISVMITFFASGMPGTDLQGMFIELDKRHCVLADRKKDASDRTIGYENDNQTVRLGLPAISLEFNFELTADNQILSSVQFYDSVHGLSRAASGLIEISMEDKVIVFPSLAGVGFTIDQLFIDLSATEATSFKAAFPEAYHPAWKGIGAQEISIIVPVDKDDDEFVIGGITGFLLDFEGNYSFKGFLDYVNDDAGALLRRLRGEVEFRNSELITSELSAIFDLKKSSDKLYQNADAAGNASSSSGDLSGDANTLSTRARTETGTQTSGQTISGFLECSIGFMRHSLSDGRQAWGIDIIAESITVGNSTSIATITGMPAKILFWVGGLGFGTFLTVKGFKEDKSGMAAGGIGLLTLTVFDVLSQTLPGGSGDSVLPVLESLSINKLGYRYIRMTQADESVEEFHEILLDWRIKMQMEGQLLEALLAIASFGFTALTDTGDLFGGSLDQIQLSGPLDLEFKNLYLRFKKSASGVEFMPEVSDEHRRLFVEPDLDIKTKALPEIRVVAGGSDSDTPKPIIGAKFVTKEQGGDTFYGMSILLKGYGNSSVQVPGAEVGVAFYFFPEFSVEWVAQLAATPRFVFLIPGIVFAEGVIDLNKPIPAFDGTQNRVAIELGVINTKVSAGGELDDDKLKELFELTNYQYQFSGEIVWGDAAPPAEYISQGRYDFLFVEFAYVGKSPLFVIGPVGVFGLGGLFGRNIAPGSSDQTALGIANWIIGSGNGSFDNVRNWPAAGPTESTWHPARDFDDDNDQFAIGLYVKAGSATDGGESISVDAILMVGFPDFWIALAGYAVIKPVNAKLTIVIVYDHPSRSFVIKAILEFKVDDEGSIIEMKVPFTFGTIGRPSRQFMYLGHYKDSEGGPIQAKLFKLFTIKAYYVIDTEDLTEFGLIPDGNEFTRPTIPGPAFGQGGMFQFGPKRYGPSFLHVEVLVALGYNIAISFNPFLVFGELFAMGYVKLKVFIFSFKLGLAARLYGIATPHLYRFAGELRVTLDLPWPFPNVSESFDFYLEGGDGSELIEEPNFEVTASGLYRLESRSLDLVPGEVPVLPIDAVVALKVNKPIYQIITTVDPADPHTQLTVNDPADTIPSDNLIEKSTTEFVGESYEVAYKHFLDRISIHENGSLVGELAASWDMPGIVGDAADTVTQPHQAVYLNTLMPPELQFSREALGRFYDVQSSTGHVSPCQRPTRVCIISKDEEEPNPEVDQSADKYHVDFPTEVGTAIVREVSVVESVSGFHARNIKRMAWAEDEELVLPYITKADTPDCSSMQLYLRLIASTNAQLIRGYYIALKVKLLGETEALNYYLYITHDNDALCGFRIIVIDQIEQVLELSIPGADFELGNTELLNIDVATISCDEEGNIQFRVDLNATEVHHLIDHVHIEGPMLILDQKQLLSIGSGGGVTVGNDSFPELGYYYFWALLYQLVNNMQLRLIQLCFRQDHSERAHWENTCIAGCGPGGGALSPEDSLDAVWDNQLLEPDTEYEISYRLHSYGSTKIVGRDEDKVPSQEKDFIFNSNNVADSTIRTVRFRTEAAPSQSVNAYVGFTFPGPDMEPLYPDALSPLISLKYRGLIQKIYEKHFGSDVLESKVIDINGEEIPKLLTGSLELGSAPTDEALEQLAQDCLPQAQGMSHLKVEVWEKQLETDTPYSLQLVNSGPAEPVIEKNVQFRTSRFEHISTHAGHIEDRFDSAVHIPVLDHSSAPTTLQNIVSAAMSGSIPSHDQLIETIYRQLLGEDTGRLALRYGSAGSDFAAYLISRDDLNVLHVWGAVLEFTEPMLSKAGVNVRDMVPALGDYEEKGLYFTSVGGQRRLIIRDFSSSRLIILNTTDGSTFNTLQTNSQIRLRFSGDESVEAAVRQYVNLNFGHETEASRNAKINDTMTQLRAIPEMADAMTVRDTRIRIPMVV